MSSNICVLGSSSAGNCTVAWNATHSLLVDCGFSFKYVSSELQKLKVGLQSLKGIVITHIHGDHIYASTVKRLVSSGIPLYCHKSMKSAVMKKCGFDLAGKRNIHTFEDTPFAVGSFALQAFEVDHDSEGGCYGFTITDNTSLADYKISIATDLGSISKELHQHFLNSSAIIIESNHCSKMLKDDTMIPAILKRRIANAHLNNLQSAEFVTDVLKRSQVLPKTIVLCHVSRDRNDSAAALNCFRKNLESGGYATIEILVAGRREPTPVISV